MTTAVAPVATPNQVPEKRRFPRCPSCQWSNRLERYPEGVAVLERLAKLAATVGQHLSRRELDAPIADFICKKCKATVVIRIGDLLRN